MKKLFVLGFGCCFALAMTSCKSSESAYKKAYEQAKQQELAEAEVSEPADVTPVVTPVETVKAEPVVAPVERRENVELVSDGVLRNYSVVCGSFGLKTNAERLRNNLVADGYNAMVVFNAEIAMYRVVASSFDDRSSAISFREQFKRRYPDNRDFQESWLLVK